MDDSPVGVNGTGKIFGIVLALAIGSAGTGGIVKMTSPDTHAIDVRMESFENKLDEANKSISATKDSMNDFKISVVEPIAGIADLRRRIELNEQSTATVLNLASTNREALGRILDKINVLEEKIRDLKK